MPALVSPRSAGARLCVAAAFGLTLPAYVGRAQERDSGRPRPFVYGGDSSFPPHEYLDGSGEPAGFNVELVRLLAAEAGVPVEFDLADWSDVRRRFEMGEVDVMSFAHSEERAARGPGHARGPGQCLRVARGFQPFWTRPDPTQSIVNR